MPTPSTIFSYPSIHGRSCARRLAHRGLAARAGASRRSLFLPSATQHVRRTRARRRARPLTPRAVLREVGRATLALGGAIAWATVLLAFAG